MSVWRQYKLFWITLLMIVTIAGATLLTNIPTQGAKGWSKPPTTFTFGYFGAQKGDLDLGKWIAQAKATSVFAAPDRMFADFQSVQPNWYPVYDGTRSLEAFAAAYPMLPAESLPGYGKSVYTIDYGNARFLFLNAAKIDDPAQMEWLRGSVKNAKQVHNVVLLSEEPKAAAFWTSLKEIGVNLVLVQDTAYSLDSVIAQQSAEYMPSAHDGWGMWQVASQIAQPHVLLLEGNEKRLFVSAQDAQGEGLDRLEQDVSKLVFTDPLRERAAVPMQSVWKYTPGRAEIKAVIPEGFDVTGEHPITQPFNLPPDDWRHPQYDDAAWNVGRAAFGHAKERTARERIETALPVDPESPSYYFRKAFVLEEDPAQIEDLLLHIAFEDGYIAYLNGEEVYRDAIRTGLVLHSTLAETSEWTSHRRISIKNQIPRLVQGVNTLAVEVHRAHPKAPNLYFDLSLSYEKKAGEGR